MTEYQRLAKNINHQLLRIESKGYEYLSPGYQQIVHAIQRVQGLKTGTGRTRISTAKGLSTPENVKMLKTLAKRLSIADIESEIKEEQAKRGWTSKDQTIEYMKSNAIFARMVDTLSAFYDSKQVSAMVREYEDTPEFDDWLSDIVESDRMQEMIDHAPMEAEEILRQYADINKRFLTDVDDNYTAVDGRTYTAKEINNDSDNAWIKAAINLGLRV